MLQFTENKSARKRDNKAKGKHSKALNAETISFEETTEVKRKPAWVDKHAAQLKVSIDDVSRLRKLKKTEDEVVIEGGEYATRLKEHFLKMQGQHAIFDWAKPKEERRRKQIQESDAEEGKSSNKMLADSESEDS